MDFFCHNKLIFNLWWRPPRSPTTIKNVITRIKAKRLQMKMKWKIATLLVQILLESPMKISYSKYIFFWSKSYSKYCLFLIMSLDRGVIKLLILKLLLVLVGSFCNWDNLVLFKTCVIWTHRLILVI
jgi:hypothetical protein